MEPAVTGWETKPSASKDVFKRSSVSTNRPLDRIRFGLQLYGHKKAPEHFNYWKQVQPNGLSFFDTVVSQGFLDALKGTLIGNILGYFACILTSVLVLWSKRWRWLKMFAKE